MMTLIFLFGFALGVVLTWGDRSQLARDRDAAEQRADWLAMLLNRKTKRPLCECDDDRGSEADEA